MRHLILPFLMLAIATHPAQAGRNQNGALVVHTNNMIIYTPDYYCETPAVPTVCEELDPNGTQGFNSSQLIWLLAAFRPEASPGVTTIQFGIEHNIPTGQGYFETFAACGPSPLELRDTGWPETGFGNLVAYGSPVYDHVFRFYFFTLYIDGSDNYFGTRTYPSTNEAKFVDDGNPPFEDLCTNFGMFRWDGTGHNECPNTAPHAGACCYCDGTCLVQLETECQGEFQGIDVPCDPNPCPAYLGACCYPDGHCEISICAQCPGQDGVWQGPGTDCDPNPCEIPPSGACCLDMDGNCVILAEDECARQGGSYMGDEVPCDPNPCFGFPIEKTTWGRIKATYR